MRPELPAVPDVRGRILSGLRRGSREPGLSPGPVCPGQGHFRLLLPLRRIPLRALCRGRRLRLLCADPAHGGGHGAHPGAGAGGLRGRTGKEAGDPGHSAGRMERRPEKEPLLCRRLSSGFGQPAGHGGAGPRLCPRGNQFERAGRPNGRRTAKGGGGGRNQPEAPQKAKREIWGSV